MDVMDKYPKTVLKQKSIPSSSDSYRNRKKENLSLVSSQFDWESYNYSKISPRKTQHF